MREVKRRLVATSRAFIPPWSLYHAEAGQLSDQTSHNCGTGTLVALKIKGYSDDCTSLQNH
ncbi:hypothetical protein TPL01_27560 [Sulfuriferula plumbiphila]|uniref:Uncharacterized protein n=1 Tax=Sulfuriferula plumbiphila TaxID=171865 RepID=A0A512LAV7_9PROT|nr:hypothetical protein SFPGR_15790 [Sulfuriferula plumbiphila]GEP31618.1 hypothetical protein TPL01_27560 [Sulfuriferula plumbiphila]